MTTLLALAFTLASSAQSPAVPAAQEKVKKNVFLLFFTKGDGARPEKAEDLQAMQKGHIANLEAHWKSGDFLAAGPMSDPTQFRRGIVVIRAEKAKDIPAMFAKDPYVQGKIMNLDVHRWDADVKGLNPTPVDPSAMEENRIVVLTAADPKAKDLFATHSDTVRGTFPTAIGGRFRGNPARAVYLFQGKDQGTLDAYFAADPLIKAGAKLEIFPLWMTKGILQERKA